MYPSSSPWTSQYNRNSISPFSTADHTNISPYCAVDVELWNLFSFLNYPSDRQRGRLSRKYRLLMTMKVTISINTFWYSVDSCSRKFNRVVSLNNIPMILNERHNVFSNFKILPKHHIYQLHNDRFFAYMYRNIFYNILK